MTATTARPAAPAGVVVRAEGLRVAIPTAAGDVLASDGVDLTVHAGQTLGVVGETGSGKSVTCRALLGLRPSPDARMSGTVTHPGVDDRDVLTLGSRALRARWGRYVSLVPQNPMTSLNPVRSIGDQIGEAVRATRGLRGAPLRRAVLELMERVGLPGAARRLGDHPHRYSGGMLQRTLIAIALAGDPRLLVADEPTTALDVLVQDQILSLLVDLQRQTGMSLVLVSHDLAVVSQMSDRVLVMYAGQVVESATTGALLTRPGHPYSGALLRSLPGAVPRDEPLQVIPGQPPQLVGLPDTCRFRERCSHADDGCIDWTTELLTIRAGPDAGAGHHLTRCRRHDRLPTTHHTMTAAEPSDERTP